MGRVERGDIPVGTALLPALSNNSGGKSGKDPRQEIRSQSSPTSCSHPFRIYDNGEIHIVPRPNKGEDGVDVDLVS